MADNNNFLDTLLDWGKDSLGGLFTGDQSSQPSSSPSSPSDKGFLTDLFTSLAGDDNGNLFSWKSVLGAIAAFFTTKTVAGWFGNKTQSGEKTLGNKLVTGLLGAVVGVVTLGLINKFGDNDAQDTSPETSHERGDLRSEFSSTVRIAQKTGLSQDHVQQISTQFDVVKGNRSADQIAPETISQFAETFSQQSHGQISKQQTEQVIQHLLHPELAGPQ